jgi:hypothetical protein
MCNGRAAVQVVATAAFSCYWLLLQDPSKRSPLQDEDAGRLLAGMRNALPVEYSGVWLGLCSFAISILSVLRNSKYHEGVFADIFHRSIAPDCSNYFAMLLSHGLHHAYAAYCSHLHCSPLLFHAHTCYSCCYFLYGLAMLDHTGF